MKAWLMRNKLWKLVSGKEPKPESTKADELAKWEEKAEQAAGELYLLVEADQRIHFSGFEEDPIQTTKSPSCCNKNKNKKKKWVHHQNPKFPILQSSLSLSLSLICSTRLLL